MGLLFLSEVVDELAMSDSMYTEYVNLIISLLRDRLGPDLVSVVLFGSVARGEAGEGSDIDLLAVSEAFNRPSGGRFDLFREIDRDVMNSKVRMRLRKSRLGTLISPVPLTPEEVRRNPPILLDILTDGIILHDKDNFIKNHLADLERKLKALGARRVRLPSGKWYWDLKPDYKLGEVVEV